jgi:DNA-binding transcriptional MerR regulator
MISVEIKQYTIQELCELTGYTRRTIRYYIQEGLIPPPAGRGRGGFYNDSHVGKLLQIKALQERGFNLATIAGLIKKEELNTGDNIRKIWIKYEVVPGMEISVSRDLEDIHKRKIDDIIKVARLLLKESSNDEQ